MLLHINTNKKTFLYAFTYNLVFLLKIVAKTYNYEVSITICKRQKKRS
jgi:hypothetical protein